MYIIRATQKLFNNSIIKSLPSSPGIPTTYDWHLHITSATFRGKLAVIYVHTITKVAVIIPGKTIQNTSSILPQRLEALLNRPWYRPGSKLKVNPNRRTNYIKNNSKSGLGYINEFNLMLNHWFWEYPIFESIDYNLLEDYLIKYPLGSKEQYSTPFKLIQNL